MNDVIISVKQDHDKIDSIDSIVQPHIIPVEKVDGIESHNSNQEKDKPHNGKPITSLEVSPNGKYLVTYSEEDHSIVGWDAKEVDKGRLKPDITVRTVKINTHYKLKNICISDDKKLARIYTYKDRNFLEIIDMNDNKQIELYFNRGLYPYSCAFNFKKNDFILCANVYDDDTKEKKLNEDYIDHYIWTYSTQTENNKWMCKGIYKIPKDSEIISISKYDKLYLLSDNYIYEWNILTGNMIRSIFLNDEEKGKKEEKGGNEEKEMKEEKDGNEKNKHIEGITSNERFICLRIKDKIKDTVTIYSIVLGISIASLDINDDNQRHQLYHLINHPGLYHLLPSLSSLFRDEYWGKCLNEKKLLFTEEQTESLSIVQTTTNHVFGVLDDNVWKIIFEEKIFFSDFGFDELNNENDNPIDDNENKIIEGWDIYFGSDEINKKINEETHENYNHLNLHLFTEMDTLLNQDIIDFMTEYSMGYESKDEHNKVKVSMNTFMDDKHVVKEFIYIEVPMKVKHDEAKEFTLVLTDEDDNHKLDKSVKIPTNILIDDKRGDEVKEFIYIKVQTNALMDKTTKMSIDENELIQGLIKIKATKCSGKKFELEVFKISTSGNERKWKSIRKKTEKCNFEISLLGIRLFNNNDIAILTTKGFFIYYFNEHNKSISLNYFYSVDQEYTVEYYKQIIKSKSTFPTPNYNSFKFNGWVEYLKSNKESLLKYGVELLTFAIKEHNIDLVEEICEKCIKYFQDDVNNRQFLSIITSTMPLLEEHYPEFIIKYSSATNMIIDSPFYNVKHQNSSLHLHSFFQDSQILTQSILWTKFNYKFHKCDSTPMKVIQLLLFPITLPFFILFIVLSNFQFINDIYKCNVFSVLYFYILDEISTIFPEHKSRSMITFMVPYIKFTNYPQDYNWIWDWFKPQSNPFIETIHSKKIYKTWNGEALINFKWNTYGKYYYYSIWIGFVALLGCFTIAATIPQEYLSENKRQILLITSIILGFIHLTFEVRQFIYNPMKWIFDSWNYLDVIVYVLPTFTSIFWLKSDITNRNEPIATLLSYSCLFLDLKLLLFFRVYKSYGRYFAITISVAKRVYIFLIVFLTIIMMSFAHALHILLSPKDVYSFDSHDPENKDPNDPWKLTQTYQVFNKDGSSTDLYVVQEPDENTNMFADYRTALFAVSLFLTGDLDALSNWKFKNNPAIVLLIVFFTFLTVIYLLNVFIGLFTEVIQDDNLEASQLILKVEMLAEIELFYLLPHQRRWKTWFPDVIYYYANVDETRERVKAMIDKLDHKVISEWDDKKFSKMKQDLLNILSIKPPENETLLQELLEKYIKSKKQD